MLLVQGAPFESGATGRGSGRDKEPLLASGLSSEVEGIGQSRLRKSLGLTRHDAGVTQVTTAYTCVALFLFIVK